LKDIPDPDPELERQTFVLDPEIEVNLFAADPLIAKPIQMNFDEAGQLWVASSSVYPQIEPGQEANDKIVVLADNDRDGRSDSTTVFADGLLIPTGIEPGDGGVYVANSTELLHLVDTNGDGRADRRRVVLSGFGTEDTHHILHTLRWGPEGLLYFNQSIYIHSHVETPHGVRRLNAGGIWHFRPETMELDVYIRGLVNGWGHHFDRWGQSFVTDGAGGEGINYAFPGAVFETAKDEVRTLGGLNPGSPKYCGAEIIGGRHLPDAWQGNIITNDFRANRVCRFVIEEAEAGYTARPTTDLVRSKSVAFRPIDVKQGPDGAIYIADWYNPIIQHGEVDFRDPRRDHVHGRIWRVTVKDRATTRLPNFAEMDVDGLLGELKSPERFTRQRAKRELKQQGVERVTPRLAQWLVALDVDDADYEHHRLEGLWTYQSLDVVAPDLLGELLESSDHRVRAAAVRVLYYWYDRLRDSQACDVEMLASERAVDDHPRVRLEAVRTLGRIGTPSAVVAAMRALDYPIDRFLDHALWLTAGETSDAWLAPLVDGQIAFESPQHTVYALEAVDSGAVVPVAAHLASEAGADDDVRRRALVLLARHGGTAELDLVLAEVLDAKLPADQRSGLLDDLVRTSQTRSVNPDRHRERIVALVGSDDRRLAAAAIEAAARWQVDSAWDEIRDLAVADVASTEMRTTAARSLALLRPDEATGVLEQLAGDDQTTSVRRGAVEVLATLNITKAASRAALLLGDDGSAANTTAIVELFAKRRLGPAALAAALGQREILIPAAAARRGLRAAAAAGGEADVLVAAIRKSGGLVKGGVPLDAERLVALVTAVNEHGDAVHGEAVFRRTDQACLSCHAIGGAGGLVGPDLTSIGGSAPVDYLVEAVLLPNKIVKENYHSQIVATDEGLILTGIPVQRSAELLRLRDAEGGVIDIPTSTIEDEGEGPSLMPDGLADTLSEDELVDLVRFLSELGKVGPFSLPTADLARRWQYPIPYEGQVEEWYINNGQSSAPLRTSTADWTPVFSEVSGGVPLASIPSYAVGDEGRRVSVLRCQLDVEVGGAIELATGESGGVRVWIDDELFSGEDVFTAEVAPGVHTVTVEVVRSGERTSLRFERVNTPFSTVRARWVTGQWQRGNSEPTR
jgi:putative heme-binding domain-containing protein